MSYVEITTGDEISRSDRYWSCRRALRNAIRLNSLRCIVYDGCYSYVWRVERDERILGKQTYCLVAYQNLLERV
jgi:hypothetical protein